MTSSFHRFLVIVTDIGDSACLIALIAAAGIYLLSRGAKRAAVFLLASLLISAFLIALLKLAFLGCHSRFNYFDIRSPSGHAAASAAVFWACAVLMRGQLDAGRRFLPLALTTLLIGLIAASRVSLEFHTIPEVCAGLFTGFVSLLLARFFILRHNHPGSFDAYAFALWCVVAVFLMHGNHLPVEHWLRSIAEHLHGHVPFCGAIH